MNHIEKADGAYLNIEQENFEKNFSSNNNFSLKKLNDYFNDPKNDKFLKNDVVKFNKDKLNTDFYKKIENIFGVNTLTIQDRIQQIGKRLNSEMNKKGIKNEYINDILNIDADGYFGKNTLKSVITLQKILGLTTNGIVDMYLIGFLFPDKFGENDKLYKGINVGINKRKNIELVNNKINEKFLEYLEKTQKTKEQTKEKIKAQKEINETQNNYNKKINNILENKSENIISFDVTRDNFFKQQEKMFSGINYEAVVNNLREYGYPIKNNNRKDVYRAIINLQQVFSKDYKVPVSGVIGYDTISLIFPNYFRSMNKDKYGKNKYQMNTFIKRKIREYNNKAKTNPDLGQEEFDFSKSKALAKFAERKGVDSPTNYCGKGVGDTLLKFGVKGLPTSGRDGYKWRKILDSNTSFEKVKINDIRDAKEGAILVYDKGYGPTQARRKYGHVEIKISNNRYFYGMFDSYPGGSVNAFKQKSGFTGYAYYLKNA